MLARDLWQTQLKSALQWKALAIWTPSGYPHLELLSPRPPETLSIWTPSMRAKHGLSELLTKDSANLTEVRRLSNFATCSAP